MDEKALPLDLFFKENSRRFKKGYEPEGIPDYYYEEENRRDYYSPAGAWWYEEIPEIPDEKWLPPPPKIIEPPPKPNQPPSPPLDPSLRKYLFYLFTKLLA